MKGFRGGPLLDIHGSLQLLNSSHVQEREKALLRSVMVGGVWNGFLLSEVRGRDVQCQFCGVPDGNGHLFWECTFPPLVEIRENPEFHDLMGLDKGHWPRCLLRHGWLPVLSGVNCASSWAVSAPDSAGYLVESALGGYSSGLCAEWSPSDENDSVEAASLVSDHPNVWSDGSLVLDRITGVSSSGAVFFFFVNLLPIGIIGVGAMLIQFARLVIFRLAMVFALFQVPSSLFRELRCGRYHSCFAVLWCCSSCC